MAHKTDEQLLDAFLTTHSYSAAARKLSLSRQAVEDRLTRLRGHGVNIPYTAQKSGSKRLPLERVRELNEFIQRYDTN